MKVKIVTNGTRGRLFIDGKDVSNKCSQYTLTLSQNPYELPVLDVQFVPSEVDVECSEADVHYEKSIT